MASFTASGWPAGATVEAYGTDAFGQKSGAAITSGTASAAGQVTFDHAGLVEGGRYVATDGSRSTNFKVPINRTPAPGPTVKVLTANMAAITSNQTVQDITGLGVDIGASATEIWLLKFWILVQADNQTMDAKFGWTSPAGAVVRWGGLVGGSGSPAGWGAAPTATSVTALGTGSTLSVGTATGPTSPSGVGLVAVVFGGGTAGTAQIRVAQNLSDPGALQILRGSMVEATKVAA